MKIKHRYKKLNFWNKYNFFGSTASIIGIPIGIVVAVVIYILAQHYGATKSIQNEIKGNTDQIVKMLQEELSLKNEQIEFLQGEVAILQNIYPSDRALELAKQIPDDSGPYALALKSIAENRFDDARRFLKEAQKQKEIELVKIYRARGQTELYAGNYKDAIEWYEKILVLIPENIDIVTETGIIYLYNGMYDKAEPLLQRGLEINTDSSDPNNYNTAFCLNNMAFLLQKTSRFTEAESMYRRSLVIIEQTFGKDNL